MERQELTDHQGPPGPKDCRVYLGSRERSGTTVRLDPLVQLVFLENRDYQEPRAETVDPELLDLKDRRETRETSD